MDITQANASIFKYSLDNAKPSLKYKSWGCWNGLIYFSSLGQLKHASDYLKGKKITTNVAIYNIYDSQEF